ncbi:crocetin glucosyltransferase 2-like [Zingiber officinale]|nr:crocetin glucosyltransferase 2-like [Zingiber officinale]
MSPASESYDHVVLIPYPNQSHINAMLQFAKRLAAHGLAATLTPTRFLLATTRIPSPGPVRLAPISDGHDAGGSAEAASVHAYLDSFERAGSRSLDDLLLEAAGPSPVRLLIFDSFLPWAGDVGRRHGIPTAAFFTQCAAVNLVYFHVKAGMVEVPVREAVELPALPRLELRDLPSFLPEGISIFPEFLDLVLNQFRDLEKVDEVLVNTVYEWEPQQIDWLRSAYPVKTVGPTIPYAYLDNRNPSGANNVFRHLSAEGSPCVAWLDVRPAASVVYVSFGSTAAPSPQQMLEVAFGLADAGKHFLWAVRSSEADMIPPGFAEEHGGSGRGLVVDWSPQLEVLAHDAVGCFVTHCGWNSTLEGMSLGVPMVAVPQWTDQPTVAKYVEDVWGVGVRAKRDEEARLVRREEVVRCVREVMEGSRSDEIRRNAAKWREAAKAAVGDGNGSSGKSTVELINKYCSKAE